MVLFFLGGGDATQHEWNQHCWTSSIYYFRGCLSVPVRPSNFKYCFPFFFLKLYKVNPPNISILYTTTHLYKVFKFIYKLCIYFFVSFS